MCRTETVAGVAGQTRSKLAERGEKLAAINKLTMEMQGGQGWADTSPVDIFGQRDGFWGATRPVFGVFCECDQNVPAEPTWSVLGECDQNVPADPTWIKAGIPSSRAIDIWTFACVCGDAGSAAGFAEMARQIAEQEKNKKWWQP